MSVDAEEQHALEGNFRGYGRPDISGNIIEANAARLSVPSKNINAIVFSLKQTTPEFTNIINDEHGIYSFLGRLPCTNRLFTEEQMIFKALKKRG